ncbi:MAG: methylated-DNA--[protein]-cysteine S-methyltransferase [Lachnospiraceae bacterium]|nr:methylated-DNA--[protein]-cysteine S-methyltransferase [Lachnospiraceae bacterium]
MYIYYYNSPLGRITLASNGISLAGLWFDGQKYFESTIDGEKTQKYLPVFGQAEHWLDIYFSGKDPGFTPPLSMERATSFRKTVWEILLSIQFGHTMSYGEIADIIAKQRGTGSMSAQAVGGAIAHNPVSLIIPCHRVIGSDGSMTGYAGGTDKKIQLLELEKTGRFMENSIPGSK